MASERSPPHTGSGASTAGALWGKPIAGPADHRPQPREKKGLGSLLLQAHNQAHLRLCRDPLLWLPHANTSTSTQCRVAASLQGSLGMVGCKPCDLRRREGDRITAHSADSPQQPGPGAWGVQGSPSTLAKICSPEVPSDSTRTSRDRDRGRSPATWILCAPARGRPAPGKARERQLCYNEAETWMLRGQVRRHAPRTSPKSPRAGGVQGAPGRGLR